MAPPSESSLMQDLSRLLTGSILLLAAACAVPSGNSNLGDGSHVEAHGDAAGSIEESTHKLALSQVSNLDAGIHLAHHKFESVSYTHLTLPTTPYV